MNFCPNCGATVESSALYCVRCGALLSENANAATDWENPYAASPGSLKANGRFAEEYADPTAPNIPGFFGAFVVCLKKFGSCKGRASRSEFWYFQLSSFLLIVAVDAFVVGVLGAANVGKNLIESSEVIARTVLPIGHVMRLFFLIPSISVCCRRLQDCGRSSWLLLWFLLPWFGAIVSSVLGGGGAAYGVTVFGAVGGVFGLLLVAQLCAPGTPGPNKFGPAPWKR